MDIGNSEVCMQKIKLKFVVRPSWEQELEEIEAILKSQRKYTNIEFSRVHFSNTPKSVYVLKKFASSVRRLKVWWAVGSVVDGIFKEQVDFPNLVNLEVKDNVSLLFLHNLLTNSTLENLNVQTMTPEILCMAMMSSSLKCIRIEKFIQPRLSYEIMPFIQSQSIEEAVLMGTMEHIAKVIEFMPNLKHLHLVYLDQGLLQKITRTLLKLQTVTSINSFQERITLRNDRPMNYKFKLLQSHDDDEVIVID